MDCNDTDTDTDVLLALVSSLLSGSNVNPDVILDALAQCDGDVRAAVDLLSTTTIKKRKQTDLNNWLLRPSTSKHFKADPDGGVIGRPKRIIMPGTTPKSAGTEPPVDLMRLLSHPPSTSKSIIPRLSPLTLSNPTMVAQNTPCTLHLSVLPPELACRLFYTMVNASKCWRKNKWWLFDNVVESPHRTAFYARKSDGDESWQEAAQFWYNGRVTDPPEAFPPQMEEACKIVEHIVLEQLKHRPRFPLEWDSQSDTSPPWRANVAASNCYEGSKESVGFHSDQLTYLGPYPTIASLSLG